MPVNNSAYQSLLSELANRVILVAVSKTKSVSEIKELYDLGQRDFGENYVQELIEKAGQLPRDIHWHFIGHLQTNKVRKIIPAVYLIQSVDSLKLLKEINKQSERSGCVTNVLLQIHIGSEDTKFGFDEKELMELLPVVVEFKNVNIRGLMGMASFTDDHELIRNEFRSLNNLYRRLPVYPNLQAKILSMGMSADYRIAIEEGSNMVRIGSMLFGERASI